MALQRLDLTPTPHPLGESIGSGLEALASHKLQQLQRNFMQQNTARGLQALGFSPQQASAYASLDPALLQMVVKQHLEEPSRQAYAQGLQAILGGGQPQQTMEEQLTYAPQQSMAAPQQLPMRAPTEGEALGQKIFGNFKRMEEVPTSMGQQVIPQQQMRQPQQRPPSPGFKIPAGLNPQQAMQLAQLGLQKQAVSAKEASAQRRFQEKLALEEEKRVAKETAPIVQKILQSKKSADEIDKDLGRMVKLITEGKGLPNPFIYKLSKDLEDLSGISGLASRPLAASLRWLQTTPESQEFEKLSANFIRGAKEIFSNRITDADLRAFMQTVPTLANTDQGKLAIIRNIKNINQATRLRFDIMNDLIKANGGKRPQNLDLLIEEIAAPELDRLAKEFAAAISDIQELPKKPGLTNEDIARYMLLD